MPETALPPSPQLPPVEPPPPARPTTSPARRFVGPAVAALALVGAIAFLVAALARIPPFGTPSGSPTAPPSASPSPQATASPSAPPSASPSPTPASAADIRAALAEIENQMTGIRQLPAAHPLDPKLIGSAEASKLLVADFNSENPASLVNAQTRLDRALGLLRPDQDLASAYARFLSTQVLGFYRDTDKSLYIVSDQGFGPLERLTAAHEYTHALQDAHFHLSSIESKATDQGDLALARIALPEGDATLAMTQWAIAELTPDELQQLAQQLQDPVAQQALADAPPIVRDTEGFPYTDGLAFIQRSWTQGGWSAVDELWQHPPDTTEQVLHPEKYDAHEAAVRTSLPASLPAALGTGWKLTMQDTMGELQTRIWLEELLDSTAATTDAAGWGGDRIGFYEGPNGGWAVAWFTEWDTTSDAQEFKAGASQVAAKLPMSRVSTPSATAVTILIASDQGTLSRLGTAMPIP